MKTTDCAKIAAEAADEKLGVDIVALDVKHLTSLAEIFLFVGATSHVHVRALEDGIREAVAEKTDLKLIRTDGQRGHLWRVLDFGSLLVHIMEQKTREFYAVERLWNAAKQVPLSDKKMPHAPPIHLKGAPRGKTKSTRLKGKKSQGKGRAPGKKSQKKHAKKK
jgi:ribosome-associated protein